MGLFNRKKETPQPILHEHTWKDMPWYLERTFDPDKNIGECRIIEPYICIVCGARKNIPLENYVWQGLTSAQRDFRVQAIMEKYKDYLQPRAVVEDMINNILLVKDVHHLHMMEERMGLPYRGVGTSEKTLAKNTIKLAPDVPKIAVGE